MRPLLPLHIALKALRGNVMRTLLTMLGVIIGVSAVICTVSIGEGASVKIRDAIVNIGANLVWVEAGGVNRNGVRTGTGGTKTLTVADMLAIREHVPAVTNVSPQADGRVQLVFGNQNWSASVRGVSPEYVALKNWPMNRGGMFTEQDVERAAQTIPRTVQNVRGHRLLLGSHLIPREWLEAIADKAEIRGVHRLGCEENRTQQNANENAAHEKLARHGILPIRRDLLQ